MQNRPTIRQVFDAIMANQVELVDKLLRENNEFVNALTPAGQSLFNIAVDNQQYAIMDVFIKHGVNPNLKVKIKMKETKTSLEIALENHDVIAIEKLLNIGVEINPESKLLLDQIKLDEAENAKRPIRDAIKTKNKTKLAAMLAGGDKVEIADVIALQRAKVSELTEPSQQWLIDRLKAYQPKTYASGVCHGVAYVGAQAVLAEDITTFNTRIFQMYALDPSEIPHAIREAYEIEKKLISEAKDQLKLQGNFHPSNQQVEAQALKIMSGHRDYQHAREIQEVAAFSDTVEGYQQGGSYIAFNSNIIQAGMANISLLQSMAMEKQGGMVEIGRFVGSYHHREEIQRYLENLYEHIYTATYPISLILSSHSHSINISYDPAYRCWFVIDANHLPALPVFNTPELVEKIVNGFTFKKILLEPLCFSSKVYVKKMHQKDAEIRMESWLQSQEWQTLHTIKKTETLPLVLRDQMLGILVETKLRHFYGRNKPENQVPALLEKKLLADMEYILQKGSNANRTFDSLNYLDPDVDLLRLFLQYGLNATLHLEKALWVSNKYLAQWLLKYDIDTGKIFTFVIAQKTFTPLLTLVHAGFNINQPLKSSAVSLTYHLPLSIAAMQGNHRLVRQLLQLGADPLIEDVHQATALSIAIKSFDSDLIDILLPYGIKPSHLFAAVEVGNLDLVKLFIQKLDVNVRNASGKNLLQIALTHQSYNHAIITLLLEKGVEIEPDIVNTARYIFGESHPLFVKIKHAEKKVTLDRSNASNPSLFAPGKTALFNELLSAISKEDLQRFEKVKNEIQNASDPATENKLFMELESLYQQSLLPTFNKLHEYLLQSIQQVDQRAVVEMKKLHEDLILSDMNTNIDREKVLAPHTLLKSAINMLVNNGQMTEKQFHTYFDYLREFSRIKTEMDQLSHNKMKPLGLI